MTLGPDWRKSTHSHTNGCLEARWRKATASEENGCVEVAHNTDEGMVLVRHSKHPGGGVVVFAARSWQGILDLARTGDLNWSIFAPLQFDATERRAFLTDVRERDTFDLPAEEA